MRRFLVGLFVLAASLPTVSAAKGQGPFSPRQLTAQEKAEVERHPLGSAGNPVRSAGPAGERAYLARLQCTTGTSPRFEREGSTGAGPYGTIMDMYLVTCPQQSDSTIVFMDMYHAGYVEDRPIPRFRITSAGRELPQPGVRVSNDAPFGCKSGPQGNGRVSGILFMFDTVTARIPGVKLTFVSDQACVETTTDQSGEYAVSLAPGSYAVQAFLAGFCKGEVASVVVSDKSDVRVGISLAVDTPHLGCPLDQTSVSLRNGSETVIAHVFFGSKAAVSGNFEYRGLPDRALQTVITLGTFAMRADSIMIDPNQTSVRARGRVLASDSKPETERRGSSASLDLTRPAVLETVVVEP